MAPTIFFFFLLSLTFSHLLSLASGNDTDLIQKTCQATKHYDLCVFSLKSTPTATSGHMDTKRLAQIMAGIGMANATSTSSYLSSQLLSSSSSSPAPNDAFLKKVLKECADKYTYAGDALQSSVKDLDDEEYDYAYMHISAAADYPNGCRNAFRRHPGLVYPAEIARREEGLKEICEVVLEIIDHIGFQ